MPNPYDYKNIVIIGMMLMASLVFVVSIMAGNTEPAYSHPVYTEKHVNYHMKKYQTELRKRAKTNRVLKKQLREQRRAKKSMPRVLVMRSAKASWYGPGFYGGTTANGTHYTPSTWGLAHKYKPFGTRCLIRYGNKSVVAPIIDRGPYSGDREFDLSGAVKIALGFNGVQTIKVRCW